MARMFISYRREDSEWAACALGRELRKHFGDEQVFRDKEDIPGGTDWVNLIDDKIRPGCVMLVLIGQGAFSAVDAEGHRRIDEPDDSFRREIASGLSRGATVIPVLLEEADMPARDDLPADLQPLERINALRLRDGDFDYDFGKIVKAIEKAGVPPLAKPVGPERPSVPVPAVSAPAAKFSGKAITAAILIAIVSIGYASGLDREGLLGALVISLASLGFGVFAYLDTSAGRAKGRGLAIATITVAALFTLGVAGNLMEAKDGAVESAKAATPGPSVQPAADPQQAPGRGAARPAPAGPGQERPAVGREAASASPTSDDQRRTTLAAMESLEQVAAQINPPAPAAQERRASRVAADDPTSTIGGRWYSDEDETILFTQHGSEVTMVVTQEGVAMQGRGAISGRNVSMTLYFGDVPIGTMSLELARDGKHLQGAMYVNNLTQPVLLRRE